MSGVFYLGRVGRLIALTELGANIPRPAKRIGGTHTALDGTTTMDTFGHKRSWEFTFDWRYRSEMRLLRALHHRSIGGQLRLIDPMLSNRLSIAVSTCGATPARRILPLSGADLVARNTDGPTGLVDVLDGCIEWTPPAAGGTLTERSTVHSAVLLPGEQVTLSGYVKSVTGRSVQLQLRVYNSAGTQTALVQSSATTSASWTRLQVTRTVGSTDAYGVAELSTPSGSGAIRTTGWQLEEGSSPTDWEVGGGSPLVLIDQMPESSPYYPMTDAGLTLLEV